MGALEEGPRYMPPEPMPQGGPAGAARQRGERLAVAWASRELTFAARKGKWRI